MENKIYDSPKPAKKKTTVQDRVIKHPITSIIGILLILIGVYVLRMDLTETVKMMSSGILFGGGLISLGLKDKKDKE